MVKVYGNEEKEDELIATWGVVSGDIIRNFDEAGRRLPVGQTGTVLVGGADSNTAGLDRSESSSEIVIWAGATQENKASAPFRVDAAGNLNATSATISGVPLTRIGTFGGDGSDGALSVPSGTTTLNLSNAQFVVKNYTTINIASGATFTFSNPHDNGTIIILKATGDVTIAGTINASGMGAAGADNTNDGENGNNPTGMLVSTDTPRGAGAASQGAAGAAGTALTSTEFYSTSEYKLTRKVLFLVPGAGGASGQKGSAQSNGENSDAIGGRGGGALLIECGGALDFSGTITASGNAGGNGNTAQADEASGSAGGGGGRGMVIVLYDSLTANTGTITTAGGAGGTGGEASGTPAGTAGGGGGGAGSLNAAGGAGGAAGATGNNAAGTGGGGGGGGGRGSAGSGLAGGSAGASAGGLVIENKYFS